MNVLAVTVESSGGGRVEEIARTFGVDWPHLAAQVVSFSIVCALLYWFAYKPVLRMLEERRRQIAQGLANTEKINAALAAIETQRREIMTAARTEAARLIEEARGVARRVKEQETQRAVAAAEQLVLKALDAAMRAAVEEGLARKYGDSITTTFVVEPSLIGGLRVKIGSDVYDGTVRGGLAALGAGF